LSADAGDDKGNEVNAAKYTTLRGILLFTIEVALIWDRGYEEGADDTACRVNEL
jgi:hypothetical protein